jgi:two-component system, OmpR family, KDP operon response regulator KdpE
VTKPFGMDELLARMRAAVRRTPAAEAPPRVRLGDLMIDLSAKRVTRQPSPAAAPSVSAVPAAPALPALSGAAAGTAGPPAEAIGIEEETPIRSGEDPAAGGADPQPEGDIRLTPTEWHLLEVLLRNPGKLLSHRQLLNDVWGPGYDNAGGNLRLYMAQLRRKLERDPARPRWLITEPGMGYRYQPPDQGERMTQVKTGIAEMNERQAGSGENQR